MVTWTSEPSINAAFLQLTARSRYLTLPALHGGLTSWQIIRWAGSRYPTSRSGPDVVQMRENTESGSRRGDCHCRESIADNLLTLIPGHRIPDELRQLLHLHREEPRNPIRVAVVRDTNQHREPGRPLHQGRDLRRVRLPDDQVPLPETRHRPIPGLRRPLADVRHVPDLPHTARGTRPVDTLGSSLPQRQLQLGPQLTAGLQVQRLIDRLVGHPHHRIVGMSHHEPGTDLLRRPFPGQSTVHLVMQPPGRHELVLPGRAPLRITTILRTNNPIRIRTAIPLDLPRNRRMMTTRQPPDITRRIPLRDTSGNQLPLLNNQCRKSAHTTPCPSVDETLEPYQGVAMTV